MNTLNLHERIEQLEQELLALEMENHELTQKMLKAQFEDHKLREIQKLAKVGTWSLNHLSYNLSLSSELSMILFGEEQVPQSLSWDSFLQLIGGLAEQNIGTTIMQEVIIGGQQKTFEHKMVKPDGETLYVKHCCETFYNSIGQPLNSVGLMQDITLEKINEIRLEQLSITDELTGLNNRRKTNEVLVAQHDLVQRYDSDCTAILFDLDLFKQFNDLFGHQTGDEVLQTVAQKIKDNLRSADICGRWGGEEFLVICQNTPVSDATMVAEKLRCVIAAINLSCKMPVTASFGVAQFSKGEPLQAFLKRLDQTLYTSKKAGRDQVNTSLYQA
ncbi:MULTISPECIES: GGDEF domain-containing protein [Pseudoalteromonas]|uniref:diguanylate cyclase n=1 Tax=Pseudoalteromonas obscura TaxID=3048491 RepID=A0ABT7ESF6_9GAMM|nr:MULTISPECIES: GGDEF domain-containing protein [Pseudoalteromonas]MBQ4835375.1 GGDEF domain-containing protein [Pseudoalteromonas luteoviolacea]MDK2597981.1 GGDEF domain-containing protein [Pseudoalteromonas sp. P94(2023)]